jgi:hypothetical protein
LSGVRSGEYIALEDVVGNVDAHEQSCVKRYRDDASRVRAIHAVANGRRDTMKRWTKLIHINPSVGVPTNRIR